MNKAKKNLITLLIAIASVLLALMIAVTCVMYAFSSYMDQYLGRGTRVVTDTGEGLDGDYINFKYNSKEEALANAQAVTQETAEEGIVLLKNEGDALPLSKSAKLTILGYYSWHNNMSGGEDPATTEGAVSIGKGLEEKFDTNEAVNSLYASANGDFADPAASLASASGTFDEYNTAVITIKRNSGEGNDQVTDSGAAEYNRTGLSINNAELKLIDFACKNFDQVIIVINAANTMEIGFLQEDDPNMNNGIYTDPYSKQTFDFSKIVGAYWAGCCGSQGGKAFANILCGEVNPSGHTPDFFARYLRNDPTYVNFGSFKYENSASLNSYANSSYFVEYEEDIYIGYRYHETAAAEAAKGNYDGYDYDTEVVYPFGYGLSYTTFSHEFDGEPTYDAETETFTFNVKVTNTGDVAGKGVAQIYVNVPWEKGQVEKAHVTLGGFAKTGVLQKGASEVVTIEIKQDYFTSYDYITEKAYLLDAGDYNFYLASDELGSHSWTAIDAMSPSEQEKVLWTYTMEERVVFNEENGKRASDEVVATNKMDDELNYKFKQYTGKSVTGDGFIYDFTRSDFKGSFPTAPSGQDYVVTDERALEGLAIYDVWSDKNQNAPDEDGNAIEETPAVNTDETSYTLADMRGVPIDDEKWDDYINQFTLDKMVEMFSNGGWNEKADEENGVPESYDADSPYGFYAGQLKISGVNKWYCGAPMVAATFNTELAYRLGQSFAEEAFQQKQNDGAPITGLYGYGMNQHRSAFGGRNYEYYSEDPVLCGKMGASEASAASEMGLITFMKHYVLNDQELHRQDNGYCSWVNEQAFREVYLRAWEIYIKESTRTIRYYGTNEEGQYEMMETEMSGATGIMSCYNRIGAVYGGASVSINGILRNEWDFTGTVITDAGGEPDTYMTTDFALRRGQNLTLTNNGSNSLYDTESDAALWWLKNSTKYLLYNKANSNCVQGIAPGETFYYTMSPWKIGIIVAWVVVGLLAVGAVVVSVLVAKDVIKVKEKGKKKETSEYDEY